MRVKVEGGTMSEAASTTTAAEMKCGAIVPYFGAKRTLAPLIVKEIGRHKRWFEIFCGSLAVTLAKPKAPTEYVNDRNGDAVNLARVLACEDAAVELYRRVSRVMMCEAMFRDACEVWKARGRAEAPAVPDLERAVEYLYASWVGRNGASGTESYNQGFAARYTSRGGHPGARWRAAVESIPAWHERLRDVVILSKCGLELAERIEDEPTTAIYADPPYIEKGAKYIHDFTPADHQRLATALGAFRRARVVVSYYDHPTVRALYPEPRWTIIECPVTKSIVNGNAPAGADDCAETAPEVLIVNGPSYSGRGGHGGLFA